MWTSEKPSRMAIKLQHPFIYSNPYKDRPSMVEIAYLSSIRFRVKGGGLCGVELTDDARADLRQYIEIMKNRGIVIVYDN